MSSYQRVELFDRWASQYDDDVRSSQADFPFCGYDQVLKRIVKLAQIQTGMRLLDLGTGTGSLAARFTALGCTVWGIDFSSEMISLARDNVPSAEFIQADITSEWWSITPHRFDRIVSSYVFHELSSQTKIDLIRLIAGHALAPGGTILIGDIAFPDETIHDQAHTKWSTVWDEDEYYWVADRVLDYFVRLGWQASYEQVSACGGIFLLCPANL